MRIDGKTKTVGIMGDPLDHTLSPAIHNAAFEYMGLNWCYVPLPVKQGRLGEAVAGLKGLGFVGANVTMPFKSEVLGLLDEVTAFGRSVGAVNTILHDKGRLIGYNTDGRGFYTALTRDLSYDLKGKRVFIFGAGGAARGVTMSLALAGCDTITIVNRSPERSERMREAMERATSEVNVRIISPQDDYDSDIASADIIINATPLKAFDGSLLRVPVSLLGSGHLVCDLNYGARRPPLLEQAAARGASVMDGKGMLLYQATAAFEIWTGLEAPVEVMRAAMFRALEEARI